MTRTPTISYLEHQLNNEQIRNARIRALEQCTVERAVVKGLPYISHLLEVYKLNLIDEFELSKLRGDYKKNEHY